MLQENKSETNDLLTTTTAKPYEHPIFSKYRPQLVLFYLGEASDLTSLLLNFHNCLASTKLAPLLAFSLRSECIYTSEKSIEILQLMLSSLESIVPVS